MRRFFILLMPHFVAGIFFANTRRRWQWGANLIPLQPVIPAKAGIQLELSGIPAFAGMTEKGNARYEDIPHMV